MYNVHEHWLLLYEVVLVDDIIHEKGGQCSFYCRFPLKSRFLKDLDIKKQVVFDTTDPGEGVIVWIEHGWDPWWGPTSDYHATKELDMKSWTTSQS